VCEIFRGVVAIELRVAWADTVKVCAELQFALVKVRELGDIVSWESCPGVTTMLVAGALPSCAV